MMVIATDIAFSAVPPQAVVSFVIDLDPPHRAPTIIDLHAPIADWLKKNKHLLSEAVPQTITGHRKLLLP